MDTVNYMYDLPLASTPGTKEEYSNYGCLLVGTLIEKLTGKSFFEFLDAAVLRPLQITGVCIFPTLAKQRGPEYIRAEDPGFGLNPYDLSDSTPIPFAQGGDGKINEINDAEAGLGGTAVGLAILASQFATLEAGLGGTGGRSVGYGRIGSTPGGLGSDELQKQGGGLGAVFNRRELAADLLREQLQDPIKIKIF